MQNFSKEKIGLIYGLSAFTLWGFLVVFFKQFNGIDPYQIVMHRVLWSVITLLPILAAFRRLKAAIKILLDFKTSFWLFLSGSLLAASWCIFIYAVDQNLVLEASLGNFISPLFSMLIGFFILKEKASLSAKLAVAIVLIAVAVQAVAIGSLPFLALFLAVVVALYGLIRKQVKVSALEGLFVENLLILPIGLAYLAHVIISGQNRFDLGINGLLLALCGPVTVVPLLLFTASTRRVNLSVIGYLQYVNPSISMALAVFIYGEKLQTYKLISFCLIWLALALVSAQGIYALKRKKNE